MTELEDSGVARALSISNVSPVTASEKPLVENYLINELNILSNNIYVKLAANINLSIKWFLYNQV